MNPSSLLLLAQENFHTTFQWGRIQSNADWILPVAVCVAVLLFVRWMYRRDAVELPPAVGWLLTALRTATIFGLLILYLQPQWRTEREVVRNSRVLLLVDTSMSMGIADDDTSTTTPTSRADQVADSLAETDFLAQLRRVHDVVVVPFSDELKTGEAVTLGKVELPYPLRKGVRDQGSGSREQGSGIRGQGSGVREQGSGIRGQGSGVRGQGSGVREQKLSGDGTAKSPSHQITKSSNPQSLIPNPASNSPHPNPLPKGEGTDGETFPKGEGTDAAIDWSGLLAPTGTETRLGQSLRELIQSERGSPVSGIVVLSDGGQNAGVSPEAAVAAAVEGNVPVFAVGIGSDRQPANVAVSDLAAPARVYPGDKYSVTGYIQAQGMAGKTVTVELLSRSAEIDDASSTGLGEPVETRQVILGGDGEALPVRFELTPDVPGRRTLCFRVQPPAEDRNPADNLREADVEIVDRKTRVLLLAGGPTREYHFLRALLFRDRTCSVDVLLQSARPGVSQEADRILETFPATREAMFDYDCVVGLDPNWQSLDAAQMDLLEKWVADQGGGLIVVAGAAYAGRGVGGWTQDPAMAPIRDLYPVEFPSRLVAFENNIYAADEPWPLDFTREGLEADFLWLSDTAAESRLAWADFPGVYSFCPVRGPKAGATVYARFSDPRTAQGDRLPVYFAGQFFGSGRVFYGGSGEMWRLRAVDPDYFDRFYTKLIRHVSQGRLLRGSRRGVLLLGQDRYTLGGTIEVRAQLTDARFDPLDAPSVRLHVIDPDGTTQAVTLRADPSRPGAYVGQFPALREGTYRLDLPIPESDQQRLTRRLQVRAPDLERENPRRNDPLLSAVAEGTGGRYYVGLSRAMADDGPDALVRALKDRTTTVILTAAADTRWEETWRRWMMTALCGLLCLEWLVRRLVKLA